MAGGLALRPFRALRWLALASLGMMLTCGTGTGTGNAAPNPEATSVSRAASASEWWRDDAKPGPALILRRLSRG